MQHYCNYCVKEFRWKLSCKLHEVFVHKLFKRFGESRAQEYEQASYCSPQTVFHNPLYSGHHGDALGAYGLDYYDDYDVPSKGCSPAEQVPSANPTMYSRAFGKGRTTIGASGV